MADGLMDIYVRNDLLQRTHMVERFASLRTVEQLHGEGAWVLEIPGWSPAVEELRRPGSGIDVRDDSGRVLFAGICLAEHVSEDNSGKRITFSGADDNVWLTRRQALQEPLVIDPSTWTQSHAVYTDLLTGAITSLVAQNVGTANERTVQHLVIPSIVPSGPNTTIRARLMPIMDLIAQACAGTNYAAWIRQVGDELRFHVGEAPLNDTVTFSPDLGGLAYTFERKAPTVTTVYVAGQGEQEARAIRKVDATADPDWPWRFEEVYDQRQEDDPALLAPAGESYLADHGSTRSLKLDATSTGWVPRVDFDIGHRVSVVVDNFHWVEKVTTVEITYTPGKPPQTVVTIGPKQNTGPQGLFEMGRRLRTRMNTVEAQ